MNLNKINILSFIVFSFLIQINNGMYYSFEGECELFKPEEFNSAKKNRSLMNGAEIGIYRCVEKAISEGADVNYQRGEMTALYKAAACNHLDIVKLLVEKGADINLRGDGVPTPLIIAAMNGCFGTVKFLLDNGADVNATYYDSRKDKNMDAITAAEEYGRDKIANYIKEYKAKRAKEIADDAPLALVLVDLIEEYEGYKLLKEEVCHESE